MKSKVNDLLLKLSMTDPASPEFLDISKQVAEAFKANVKEKMEKIKVPKEPKTPKAKAPKTMLCDDCGDLLMKKLEEIII
jgi:hypothetical protein